MRDRRSRSFVLTLVEALAILSYHFTPRIRGVMIAYEKTHSVFRILSMFQSQIESPRNQNTTGLNADITKTGRPNTKIQGLVDNSNFSSLCHHCHQSS